MITLEILAAATAIALFVNGCLCLFLFDRI